MDKPDSNKPLWIFGGVILLLSAAGWYLCWRTNSRAFIYVLTPVLLVVGMFFAGMGVFALRHWWNSHRSGKWGAPLCAVIILTVSGKNLVWDAWPEIAWGAPVLRGGRGNVLVFEGGKEAALRISEMTTAAKAECAQWLKKRMTLRDIHHLEFSIVWNGWAKNAGGVEYAEEEARRMKYGIWGGGSYEKDLDTLDALRERHGKKWTLED